MIKASVPTKTQSAFRTDSSDLNYPSDQRISKAESTLLVRLAVAGHGVHVGDNRDFIVVQKNWGHSRYCQDYAALIGFGRQLGVL